MVPTFLIVSYRIPNCALVTLGNTCNHETRIYPPPDMVPGMALNLFFPQTCFLLSLFGPLLRQNASGRNRMTYKFTTGNTPKRRDENVRFSKPCPFSDNALKEAIGIATESLTDRGPTPAKGKNDKKHRQRNPVSTLTIAFRIFSSDDSGSRPTTFAKKRKLLHRISPPPQLWYRNWRVVS